MIITILASHFKGVDFSSNCDCALARAVQSVYTNQYVREGVNHVQVGNICYSHEPYEKEDFEVDLEMAKEFDYSDQVAIRKIELYDYKRDMEPVHDSGGDTYLALL